MLTTCITVTIIFTMLMYEISHSMKDVVDEAIDNIITDDTSTILRYDRLTYEESWTDAELLGATF
uniref:Two-component sensor histidine kinase n=1 Tax=Haemonchus contortus TaxID=6289 RepID=A0A7I5E5R5_HAECO